MNVTSATFAQNFSSAYKRQETTASGPVSKTATQGDSVAISEEARAQSSQPGAEGLTAFRLPDWYANMVPAVDKIDLSVQQIGMSYRDTNAYALTQLSQQDQQSIHNYSEMLSNFFQEELGALTQNGSVDYVQVRDSDALEQAVMARFESNPNANALLVRMKELGQVAV